MAVGHWSKLGTVARLAAGAVGVAAALAGAQVPSWDEVPGFEGKHQVLATVGEAGARFSLDCGFSVVLPPGGAGAPGRALSLAVADERVRGEQVAEGFVPIGPSVRFDAAPQETSQPLLVSYVAKRFALRRGHRAVLVVERRQRCDEGGERPEPDSCKPFSLKPARYDARMGLVIAELERPGGPRMQFGSVPQQVSSEENEP